MRRRVLAVMILALLVPASVSAEEDLVERGRELFNSTSLGTNSKSCASCHPNGDKLERAAAYSDKRLVKIINMCIRSMLKGNALPASSVEMTSLIGYVRTFAAP